MASYVALVNGLLQTVTALVTSAGAGDAGKIVALDGTGRIDTSILPAGIGSQSKQAVAFETIAAGKLVNLYDNAGTVTARLADCSNGRQADGFATASVSAAATGSFYVEGIDAQLTGLTAGVTQFLGVAGAVTTTPPSTSGHISQVVGRSVSATEMKFNPQAPITLA